jgi:hypothetical protein
MRDAVKARVENIVILATETERFEADPHNNQVVIVASAGEVGASLGGGSEKARGNSLWISDQVF